MNNFRVDFYGPDKTVLYTVKLPQMGIVENFMREVLVYDLQDPNGPFSLTIWEVNTQEQVARHTIVFRFIPEHTAEAFKAYNDLYPEGKTLFPKINENDQQEHPDVIEKH